MAHRLCSLSSLIANGDLISPASRLLIPRKALNQWDHVLQMVTEKITLRSGAVHRYVKVILGVDGFQSCWKYSQEALKSLLEILPGGSQVARPQFEFWLTN